VAWYGRLISQPNEMAPKNPIDVVGELKAPVLGLYGGQDQGIPVDTVEKMRAALKNGSEAAKRSMIQLYPEAPHGFHADYRGSYREADAKDAWQRMLIWFKKHRVG
jgi:carboxymethylenebutenolidase